MLQVYSILPDPMVGLNDQSRRSSMEMKLALDRRISFSNSTVEALRRQSNDFEPKKSDSRKAFYSPSVSITIATRNFWNSLRKLSLVTKNQSFDLNKENINENLSIESVGYWTEYLTRLWKNNQKESFLAFECILQVFEICLDPSQSNNSFFEKFIQSLGDNIVVFLKESLVALIDSDNLHNTDYVDMLLLYLSMYNVKTGKNILADFIDSIPYFGGFYLKQHDKRFQELFCYIYTNEIREYNSITKCSKVEITPHYLSCLHFPPKKVIVSNAPPVKLKRRRLFSKDKFECEVSAGGLVSGMKPSLEKDDVWVSYLDSNILGLDKVPDRMVPHIIKESVYVRPKFRRSTSMLRCSISEPTEDENKTGDEFKEFLYEKAENDFLSLQTKLDRFAEQNFEVNPLIIMKEEHTAFYNGISNGLFWPAFHNVPEYIIDEYRGENGKQRLAEDWSHYVKVNHHFAIHAARSCRQQDFLWIHDYHLFLVGLILRSLDPTLDCGFFLHIPFGLTEEFIKNYPEQGLSVLRGLLGFTRVGFQTNKDTINFINMIKVHFPSAEMYCSKHDGQSLVFSISFNSAYTDVGTFPISIKKDSFLKMASDPGMDKNVIEAREKVMQGRRGKLFLSVERFDYTKGILERMKAIKRYFEKYPQRVALDVFYQVAASSRTDVSSYKQYQASVIKLVDEINALVANVVKNPQLKAVIIDQTNHPQEEVVWLYKAADIIVATPIADGMNLVIKEAILCNPKAVYILSSGAGAENELFDNGLNEYYFRMTDVCDNEAFADLMNKASQLPSYMAEAFGQCLFEYTKQHDIDHWISSFVDHNWTQKVVKRRPLLSIDNVKDLMNELRVMRRRAVEYLLENTHVGIPFQMSLNNVLESLKSIVHAPNKTMEGYPHLQISSTEVTSLQEDLAFLDFLVNRKPLHDLILSFQSLSPTEEQKQLFNKEYHSLKSFLQTCADADLVIFRWEHAVLNHGSFEFATMHSIAGGLLLSRFIDRFSTHAILWTEQTYLNLQQQFIAPSDTAIFATLNGAEVYVNNRLLFSHKSEKVKTLEELYRRIKKLIDESFDANHAALSYKVNEACFIINFARDQISMNRLEKFWFDLSSQMIQVDPQHHLSLKVHNIASAEIFIKSTEALTPNCTNVLNEIIKKLNIKLSNRNPRIVIFGGDGNDFQWIKWSKQMGADVRVAFWVSNVNYFDRFQDLNIVQYNYPRALMAAMADHVLRKVRTNF